MTVALYTHQDMFDHRPGDHHPERPERLKAVVEALNDSDLDLAVSDAPIVERADLARVHPGRYIDAIEGVQPGAHRFKLDEDTFMSAGSLNAGRRGQTVAVVRNPNGTSMSRLPTQSAL